MSKPGIFRGESPRYRLTAILNYGFFEATSPLNPLSADAERGLASSFLWSPLYDSGEERVVKRNPNFLTAPCFSRW